MEEILNSIKDAIKERVSSPLFGIFIISWAIINYQLLVVAFGKASAQDKIYLMQEYFIRHEISIQGVVIPGWVIQSLFCPSILVIFYVFLYPYLAIPVYEYSLETKRKLREKRMESNDLEIIDKEQSRQLNRNLAEAYSRIKNLEDQLNNLGDSLNKTIEGRESEIKRLESRLNNANRNIEKARFELIENRILKIPHGTKFAIIDLFSTEEINTMKPEYLSTLEDKLPEYLSENKNLKIIKLNARQSGFNLYEKI